MLFFLRSSILSQYVAMMFSLYYFLLLCGNIHSLWLCWEITHWLFAIFDAQFLWNSCMFERKNSKWFENRYLEMVEIRRTIFLFRYASNRSYVEIITVTFIRFGGDNFWFHLFRARFSIFFQKYHRLPCNFIVGIYTYCSKTNNIRNITIHHTNIKWERKKMRQKILNAFV